MESLDPDSEKKGRILDFFRGEASGVRWMRVAASFLVVVTVGWIVFIDPGIDLQEASRQTSTGTRELKSLEIAEDKKTEKREKEIEEEESHSRAKALKQAPASEGQDGVTADQDESSRMALERTSRRTVFEKPVPEETETEAIILADQTIEKNDAEIQFEYAMNLQRQVEEADLSKQKYRNRTQFLAEETLQTKKETGDTLIEQANERFRTFRKTYPDEQRYGAIATLHIGLNFFRLDRGDSAVAEYERLNQEYGDLIPEMDKYREQLKRLEYAVREYRPKIKEE